MRYLKIGASALVALVLVGLIAVITHDRLSQPPAPDRATLIAEAAHYHARIQRDHFGVPHISGPTDPDVAFGLGFAHSEDDFATIQDAALISRGQLASVQGAKAAVTDYLVRLLKVRETVDSQYDTRSAGRRSRGAEGLCRRGELLRGPASGKSRAWPVADDRQGRRRRVRVPDAVFLWPRSRVREDYGACAEGQLRSP